MGKSFEFLKQKLLVMELEVTTVKGRNQLQQERRELPELGFEKKTKTKRTHEKQRRLRAFTRQGKLHIERVDV